MNSPNANLKLKLGLATTALCFAVCVGVAWAQDTSTATVRHGPSSYDTTVKNAEVVYVSGNDLVLKVSDGRVEHLKVPDSDKFTVDGKELTVHDLQPGTKLTQTITTKTTPRYVNTVRTIEGTIWHINAPSSLVLRFDDGSTKRYSIPSGQKFKIDGKDKTAFELKKGMKISATVITDEPQTVVEQAKSTAGQAPKPETPAQVGALLVLIPRAAPAASAKEPTETANAEPLPKKLPKTGSALPLVGLLGLLSVGASLILRLLRQQ